MKIFDQLKQEHEELKDLLATAESCSPQERESVLSEIEMAFVPHARGEEKTLYAVVRQKAEDSGEESVMNLSNEAYEEHYAVDMLMAELRATDVEDETWLAKLTVIKENVEHHIEEEEEELFPRAKKLLSTDEQEGILSAYTSAKTKFEETLPTQDQISARTPSEEARGFIR